MVFDQSKIKSLHNRTPFFVFSKRVLLSNLREYQSYLPTGTEICYAMKANSEKILLQILNDAGSSFEVASKYELSLLKEIKVSPQRITYGTSIKPEDHIKEFLKYGVDRFAFDSVEELLKIAKLASQSRVYARVLVDDKSDSVFSMSEKFGVPLNEAIVLLLKAKELGLVPYGISFNVGSQARNVQAWARGIEELAGVMEILLKKGIKIQVINFGGGFPHSYQKGDGFPHIKEISEHIHTATEKLPYKVGYIAEPGRGIVANAFVLIMTVIGKSRRSNGHWLYLDAGVYNAFLESMTCQGSTKYRIEPLSAQYAGSKKEPFILTGPTGDNLDIINQKQLLPTDIKIGDKLLVNDVGAYTFPLTTRFNGFPKPRIIQL